MTQLTLLEQLCYCTTRIECTSLAGQTATGTGFFFSIVEDADKTIPFLFTNNHVVRGMTKGRFRFTKADTVGHPLVKDHFIIELDNFESGWTSHPDTSVDLCAMPIGQILNAAAKQNTNIFFRTFDDKLIPTDEQKKELDVVEDILMIGYPNGIWDEVNNQPIIRKGTSATHPALDYNGKKEFMIDAACFPGSSGSPVLVHNKSGYSTKAGGFVMGSERIHLLGVLYAGPQHTATGEIKVVNVPTLQVPLTISRIPNNLGIVLKSERITEMKQVLKAKFKF
jgi:hypothetical protein